jgi:hypothetical protein
MKQLNLKKILDAIKQARYEHSKGILNPDIKNSTTPEFWSQTRNSNLRKKQLIQLAKSKQPRPHSRKHPLGCSLNNYTDTKKSTYDPKFTKQIKSLAPHWFISRSNKADANKQQLLQIAKTKQPRPNSKSNTLGRALVNYVNQTGKCFDPVFTKKIKSLAPHWFKK